MAAARRASVALTHPAPAVAQAAPATARVDLAEAKRRAPAAVVPKHGCSVRARSRDRRLIRQQLQHLSLPIANPSWCHVASPILQSLQVTGGCLLTYQESAMIPLRMGSYSGQFFSRLQSVRFQWCRSVSTELHESVAQTPSATLAAALH